jgi:flagellar protein FliJ
VPRDFSLAGLLRLRRLQEDESAGRLLRARSRASELAAQRTHVRDSLLDD